MAEDWYRNRDWNDQIEAAFRARWKKCRRDHTRTETIRLQAATLISCRRAELAEVALGLMNEIGGLIPPGSHELAMVEAERGRAYEVLGDIASASRAYRRAWEVELAGRGSQTQARRRLAMLIVIGDHRECADEALRAVGKPGEDSGESMFPQMLAEGSLVRATIAQWRNIPDVARRAAEMGLDAAAQQRSCVAREPEIGVLRVDEDNITNRLTAVRDWAISAMTIGDRATGVSPT